jgi:hypothetical protein
MKIIILNEKAFPLKNEKFHCISFSLFAWKNFLVKYFASSSSTAELVDKMQVMRVSQEAQRFYMLHEIMISVRKQLFKPKARYSHLKVISSIHPHCF